MTVIVNTGSTLTVTNASGLTITSDSTVASGGLLDGSGTIAGNFTLLNLGTISADVPGAVLSVNTGTLTNQGTIFANNGSLTIQSSVAATNLAGTVLNGGVWEASGTGALGLLTGQIVTDNATITLIGAASVFDGFASGPGTLQPIDNSLATIGASGVLNLLGGRNFQTSSSLIVDGTVTLGGGTLAAPTNGLTIGATGVIAGFGALDSGTVVNDAGTIEAKGGTLTVPQQGNVVGAGTLQADAGASLVLQAFGGSYAQSIVNNGTIDAAFAFLTGTLDMTGSYSGTGGFLIQGGFDAADRTVLELPSGLSANVAFDGNFGELLLDGASTFHGTVSGFGNSSTIVMPTIANAQQAQLTGNILNVKNSGGTVLQSITFDVGSMNYGSALFSVTENLANSQATVKASGVQPPCFTAGTQIKTQAGEVPVEHLVAGDIVHAHFAGTAPIVWIGHRHVDCRRHPEPANVWPVRVSAHAFGPRMPNRDLVLSPDHAVFVDDVLIPIKHLINGETIVQERVATVTYYHVELGEHDVLLADGMPAESYLENGDRAAFDNAGRVVALHPDFGMSRWEALGCAPLVVTGSKLDAVAARLRVGLTGSRQTGGTSRQVA